LQKTTILSGVVKQNSDGKQQTLAELFKDLVAGANIKKAPPAATTTPLPEKAAHRQGSSHIQTNAETSDFFSRQGVSNLTARLDVMITIFCDF
jgi:hypothetical protein